MLFNISNNVLITAICLLALILIACMLIDFNSMKSIFVKTVAITLIITVLLMIMIIFYMIVDFYNFWLFFHELIFTNDLYMLDPYTDLLINIMPLDFFVVICLNVSMYFGLLFAGSFAIMYSTRLMKRITENGYS